MISSPTGDVRNARFRTPIAFVARPATFAINPICETTPTIAPTVPAVPMAINATLRASAARVPEINHPMNALTMLVVHPRAFCTPPRNAGAAWKIGLSRASPRRPAAAPTFCSAPVTVCPMTSAPPPTMPSITWVKSSKLTFPSDTIFSASSVVTP